MNSVKPGLSALLIFLLATSCNRKEDEQLAGKGGNAVLNCIPKHHDLSKNILNGKIYIKYNAQDAPVSFDDSANCIMTDGQPVATFTGLKAGKYYLYGNGFDTSINQPVKGGIPYTINSETTLNVTVPVTEGD